MKILKDEMIEMRESMAMSRRTEIVIWQMILRMEDMIADEAVVITISATWGISNGPVSTEYRSQGQGRTWV
jgi:DNA gyrase subunit A